MFKLLTAALLLGAALAGQAFAAAGAPKPLVAIVDVGAPPTMMGLAAQVTREVVQAALAQDYPLLRPEELRAQLGEKAYVELQRCEAKSACIRTRMAGVRADRVVIGSLGRDEKNYLVHLVLLDLATGEVIAEVDRSILIASRRLNHDVTAAVPRLLRGEKEATGTLKLTSNAHRVAVTIDGEDKGFTPLTLELKPGKHEVHFEKKAYMPVDRLVTIEAGQVSDEQVRLIVIPGETPEEDALPPDLIAEVKPTVAGEGLRIPTGAYVAGGAALVAGAAGLYFAVSSSTAETKLKSGFDPATGVYQGTRKEALGAQQNASLANLCFAAAGVALATGAVVTLVTGPEPASPKARLAPVATAGGGGVVLLGSFP